MKTLIKNKSDKDSIETTADILKNGGIVIIPTDTVYGFSGIVDLKTTAGHAASEQGHTNPEAGHFETDSKIRAIKGRAETKPLIQLIARPEDLSLYTNDEIPQSLLAKWPGALTIIVHIKNDSPLAPSAALPTIAFRCPGDAWLREVISHCNAPIFSTSVNRSGQPVLDTEDAITTEFSSQVDLIILDGDKKNALPSTLVSIEAGAPKILRQGAVTL